MAFDGRRRLVSLGFGPIGAGLFVYEAHRASAYEPPLVVDVRRDLVEALRAADGHFRLDIAHADGIEVAEVGPVRVADPTVAVDRTAIIGAIAEADELASALPSVAFYEREGASSPQRLLADGLQRRIRPEPLIVYCAENHRRAASLLEAAVLDATPPAERIELPRRARFVDTVIGKMSGVISDPAAVARAGLGTVTDGVSEAFLVEDFDRILVSKIGYDLRPGMPSLREVDDLAPFEDAKLLGHNATHALAGFLGSLLGVTLVADLPGVPGAMAFLRAAFIEEAGAALRLRWAGADDLFTEAGFVAYADDLLERMVNPFLADTIERAARDPRRKLGWDDRLVGLLRLGLTTGVGTRRYAMGVAAGLELLRRAGGTGSDADLLQGCWPADVAAREADGVLARVADGRILLDAWRAGGFEAHGLDGLRSERRATGGTLPGPPSR